MCLLDVGSIFVAGNNKLDLCSSYFYSSYAKFLVCHLQHWLLTDKEVQQEAEEAAIEPIQAAEEDQENDDVTEEESNEQSPPVEERTDEPEKNEPNEQEDPKDSPAIQVDYELWIIFHFPLRMYLILFPCPA